MKAIAWLRSQSFVVAVATNQSGMAEACFTFEQVHAFHAVMDITIQAKDDRIDMYASCPHITGGAEAEYVVDCDCRKPKPGLINQLLEQLQVGPECAVLIGDCEIDLLAGQAAGVESFRYDGGDLFEFTSRVISANFGLDAVDLLEATSKASRS